MVTSINALSAGDIHLSLWRHIRFDDWKPEDRFDLAFVPHMSRPGMSDQEVLQRTLDLALAIPDANERNLMAGILLGLSGKAMSDEEVDRLKEFLKMTDLLKAIEREAAEGKAREIAINMLMKGMDVDVVVEMTNLGREQVEELRKQVH